MDIVTFKQSGRITSFVIVHYAARLHGNDG
jgi:hypothetical protein